MNRDSALVCSFKRGDESGSGENWTAEGVAVCQVEDGLTSATRKLRPTD